MPPTQIGPYKIVGKIGTGGMGAVYEAIHEVIERRVAIKVLHAAHASDPSVVNRFFNEARAVNRIEHPGLVQISDCGQLEDGTLYIVMEFLRGITLKQRFRDRGGRLSILEALRLGKQVASALAAAHAKSIVHRDIKPENIMLVSDAAAPDGERVKLLDFGIAKLVEDVQQPGNMTATDQIIGTPLYMSPEQCRGGGDVDAKADVYSLGVLLYHMIGGRPPFLGAGNGELLAKHIYEAPPSLLEFAPTAPPALADFIHRLLHKDRLQRPATEQVLRELEEMAPSITQVSKVAPSIDITTPPASAEVMTPVSPASSGTQLAGQSSRADSGLTHHSRKLLITAAGIVVGALCLALVARQGLKSHAQVSGHEQVNPAGPPPVASRPGAGTPAPPPINVVSPLSTPVHWHIKSTPSGATVLRIRDGRQVGQTPWQAEQPAEAGSEQLLLRLHGHADKLLTLDRSADAQREERLIPVKQPAATKRGRRVAKSSVANKKAAHDSVELEE